MSLLCLEEVRKSYWRGPHETVVLDSVSLVLKAGELVAVWGQRGSGKTTLAMVAAGLQQPDRGRVSFEGQQLGGGSRGGAPQLPEGIGWMQRMGPQSSDFRSVLDYVALPMLGRHSPREARRLAVASLRRIGVADCAAAQWSDLSDGERTLVALAHALVREPRLLIADDPTTNLDVLQREHVTTLLREAVDEQGLGILITVPDMPESAHADRCGSLSDGRLMLPSELPEGDGNVIEFPGNLRSA